MIEFLGDPALALWVLAFSAIALSERVLLLGRSPRRAPLSPWIGATLTAISGLSHPLEDLHRQPGSTYEVLVTSLRVTVLLPLVLALLALLVDRVVVAIWLRRTRRTSREP